MSKLTVVIVTCCMAVTGCGFEVSDEAAKGPESSEGSIDSQASAIRAGIVQETAHHLVQIVTDHGGCSGTLIARDAILTAAHCFGDLVNRSSNSWSIPRVRISRKTGPNGQWECLSHYDNTYPKNTNANNACSQDGWSWVDIHPNASISGGSSNRNWDVAIMRPRKSGDTQTWVTSELPTWVSLDLGSPMWTQIGYGVGYNSTSGTGFGEARSGIFGTSSLFISTYQYSLFGEGSYRFCGGDSGGPAGYFYVGGTVGLTYALAGVHSGGPRDGECASTANLVRVSAKLGWIEQRLGRTCRRFTADGRPQADCW